jgi:hypothetical protein
VTLKELEARIQIQEDIEAIRKLQYAYGYYLQHWQEDEIKGLFSIEAVIDMDGFYTGKSGIEEFFSYQNSSSTTNEKAPPEFLNQNMPLCGIIDVDTSGKTAKGRWYGFGVYALPSGGKYQAQFRSGIWENEFIKEDGKWKFKRLHYSLTFACPYEDGWVKTPNLQGIPRQGKPPRSPNNHSAPYPSGYIEPYHYKNPVTEK